MANVIYPTAAEYGPPWFVDRNALEEFDRLIDDGSERLARAATERFERKVEQKLAEYASTTKSDAKEIEKQRASYEAFYSNEKLARRNLKVHFGDTKHVDAQSFAEVFKDHRVRSDVPTGFEMTLTVGDISSQTSLNKRGLQLRVSPQESAVASDVFGSLNDWARRHRAPAWQVFWKEYAGLHWVALILVFIVLASAVSGSNRATKQQARELLAHGLQAADEHRALELILRLVSDMDESIPTPRWFLWATGAALIVAVVLSFAPPSVILALGGGEARLRRWKFWLRFIFYGVPIFLATTIVGFYIRELLPSLRTGTMPKP